MPWKSALHEVYQDEAHGLEVVSPGLFYAQMGVHAGVTGSARERLVVLVWDVLTSFGVSVPLGQTKINYIDYVLLFTVADQEIVRLHVSVDKVIIVKELESLDHLVREHQGSLHGEFSLAVVE